MPLTYHVVFSECLAVTPDRVIPAPNDRIDIINQYDVNHPEYEYYFIIKQQL